MCIIIYTLYVCVTGSGKGYKFAQTIFFWFISVNYGTINYLPADTLQSICSPNYNTKHSFSVLIRMLNFNMKTTCQLNSTFTLCPDVKEWIQIMIFKNSII